MNLQSLLTLIFRSPSPRRAWIEMSECLKRLRLTACRPPHGGRGLKWRQAHGTLILRWSPSPRRAWIEIKRLIPPDCRLQVALPTEGVD